MKSKIYTMKVILAGRNNIFRQIEISGNSTLDTLSNTILNAYDFDREHLYFFSMNKKVNPDTCYYHPMAGGKINADGIKLDVLQLKAGKEFYYLYDYEWLFIIKVEVVMESDIARVPRVGEGAGTLEQYPAYEDENEDPDEDLTIEITYQEHDVIEQRLRELPAYLQHIWKLIAAKNLPCADSEIMQGIYGLGKAGLLEFEEDPYHLAIRVYSDQQGPGSIKCLKNLSKRMKVEQIVDTLIHYYGVIETQKLEQISLSYEIIAKSKNVSVQQVIVLLAKWKDFNLFTDHSGISYVSIFCQAVTDDVLNARKKYPTKEYRELSKLERKYAEDGLYGAIVKCYSEVFHYLMFRNFWYPEDAEQFLEQAVKCIAMGYSEAEYMAWAKTAISEAGERMPKKMETILKKFRKDFPSAALRGYTWGEYEAIIRDGNRQLSLFDKELPFVF